MPVREVIHVYKQSLLQQWPAHPGPSKILSRQQWCRKELAIRCKKILITLWDSFRENDGSRIKNVPAGLIHVEGHATCGFSLVPSYMYMYPTMHLRQYRPVLQKDTLLAGSHWCLVICTCTLPCIFDSTNVPFLLSKTHGSRGKEAEHGDT